MSQVFNQGAVRGYLTYRDLRTDSDPVQEYTFENSLIRLSDCKQFLGVMCKRTGIIQTFRAQDVLQICSTPDEEE